MIRQSGSASLEAFRAVVRSIPRGSVMTYGEVAAKAGKPTGARQVVRALHNAPGLPWHRVVGAGLRIRLTGPEGFEQRFRLESEGWRFRGSRLIPPSNA